MGRQKNPRRSLSRHYAPVLAYIAEHAGGADGKTYYGNTERIIDSVGIDIDVLHTVLKYLDELSEIAPQYAVTDHPPPTPRLDAALTALDVTQQELAGAGANIKFLPVVEEALALRRWVKERYGK